jgi:hypothetical protein
MSDLANLVVPKINYLTWGREHPLVRAARQKWNESYDPNDLVFALALEREKWWGPACAITRRKGG